MMISTSLATIPDSSLCQLTLNTSNDNIAMKWYHFFFN